MPMLVVSGGPKPGQVGVEGVNVVFRIALASRLSILKSDGWSSSRHANVKVTVLLSNMNSEICVPEGVVAAPHQDARRQCLNRRSEILRCCSKNPRSPPR